MERKPMTYDDLAELNRRLCSEFNKHLQAYVIKNLNRVGFFFNSDTEFFDFIKDRVTRIEFEETPNTYFIYVDFIDKNNRGIYVGSYSHDVSYSWKENTITATIGKKFK